MQSELTVESLCPQSYMGFQRAQYIENYFLYCFLDKKSLYFYHLINIRDEPAWSSPTCPKWAMAFFMTLLDRSLLRQFKRNKLENSAQLVY